MALWTTSDKEFLVNNYHLGIKYCAKCLNRTEKAIVGEAKKLGISKDKLRWTDYEIEELKSNFHKLSILQLSILLNKTQQSVKIKSRRIGLKKPARIKKCIIKGNNNHWSSVDLQFVIDNYKKISLTEISKHINRTIKAIKHKLTKLQLTNIKALPWDQNEIDFLKNNYTNYGCLYCSKKLNRSYKTVYSKASIFKLPKISHEKAVKRCNKYKLKLLSDYKNNTSLSTLQCYCGIIFKIKLKSVFSGHTKTCGNCKLRRNSVLTSRVALDLHQKLIDYGYPTTEKDHNYKTKYGKYIDIAIPKWKIAIEYDGWHWHHSKISTDLKQTKLLIKHGWKVLRIRSNWHSPRINTINKYIDKLKNGSNYEVITCKSWYKASNNLKNK